MDICIKGNMQQCIKGIRNLYKQCNRNNKKMFYLFIIFYELSEEILLIPFLRQFYAYTLFISLKIAAIC